MASDGRAGAAVIPGFAMMCSPKAAGGGSTYLDSLAITPTAVLSLKKLISTATNSIRVRRSSDNAEQDIGFTGDALNISALAAFVGANSAYVTTFYDQTGNGKNLIQATAGAQPRIVNAGAYDGKALFNGTSQFMKITSLTQGTPQFGVYGKLKAPTNDATRIIFEGSTDFNTASQCFTAFAWASAPNWNANASNAAGAQRSNQWTQTDTTNMLQPTWLFNRALTGSSEIALFINGIAKTATPSGATEMTGSFTAYDVYIGSRAGTSRFADISLETLVFYNGDTAAIRASIEGVL